MLPRDKKGCFRRLKEIKRGEMSAVNCKRPGKVVEEVEMGTGALCESQVASSYWQIASLKLRMLHQVQVGDSILNSILKWPIYPRYSFTLLDQRDQRKDGKDICAYFEPQRITRPHADRNLGKGARRFVLQEDIRDSSRNP